MPSNPLKLAMIGDRNGEYLPHVSAETTFSKLSRELGIKTQVVWIPTGMVKEVDLNPFHLIWSGSGPYLDPDGAMEAIRFARENGIPFIGTCSGFKYTIIELAKNAIQAEKPEQYISMNESCGTEYKDLQISLQSPKVKSIYGASNVSETSHCRFEITSIHQEEVNQYFTFSGTANDGRMVIAELTSHPFYFATLFLPQLQDESKLLKHFIRSAAMVLN